MVVILILPPDFWILTSPPPQTQFLMMTCKPQGRSVIYIRNQSCKGWEDSSKTLLEPAVQHSNNPVMNPPPCPIGKAKPTYNEPLSKMLSNLPIQLPQKASGCQWDLEILGAGVLGQAGAAQYWRCPARESKNIIIYCYLIYFRLWWDKLTLSQPHISHL